MRWLLVFCALALAACSGLPWNTIAPKVSVAEVSIKRLGWAEQHFDVGLQVDNPNDFDLKIEALEFELELNGRPFAKGQSPAATLIPASSSAMLRVDALMQSGDLIQQLKTLSGEAWKAGVPYRLKGRVRTDRSSRWLPFDHTGVVGGDANKTKGKTV
jgi:LEA14-like dessication related protein